MCACVCGLGGGGVLACVSACWVCSDESSDGYSGRSGRRNTEYPALSNASLLRGGVHLEDLMYLNE